MANALILAAILAVLLAAALLAPLFPCPSCDDLELSVFGCEFCRRKPREEKRLSLIERWKAVRALEAEGCPRLPLLPRRRVP